MKQALHISWIAVRELIYERVFHLLFSFIGLALILSVLLGQLTYGEQTKLTIDFMLGSAHIAMILFSIFMGISLFQRELQMGSISMLLSKPVSRTSFLGGKYLGQILVQLGVMLAITGIIILSLLRFEGVQYIPILQALLLMFFESCIVTAITYFFSVNSGSITTALSSFVMFVIGHYSFSSSHSKSLSSKPGTEIILSLVPNLEIFNLKTFASYGVTTSNLEIILSMSYALICIVMFLVAAALTFHRKDILT